MLPYVLRRLALFVPTLLGITFLSFALLHLAPGDPARLALAGGEADAEVSAEALARFRAAYLLDRPLLVQYLHYLGPFDLSESGHRWFGGSGAHSFGGLLLGDLKSEIHRPHVRVADELARRLRVTLPLAAAGLLLAYLLALPLGIGAALRAGSPFDRGSGVVVFLLYCVPTFWAALLLQLAFGATGLGWLPVVGLAEPGSGALEVVRRSILPVVCLAYGAAAYLSRQVRAGLVETLSSDYVRTARAKGLPEALVIGKHALRNGLLPIATLSAAVFPALIGGAVIVETIFDLPGMGRYAFEGLQQRDYFVVMATTTLSGVMTCAGILVSDLLTAALDPHPPRLTMVVLELEAGGAFARARAHLARRRGFRLALLGLAVLASLSVYAPFLASDRPLYLEAVHRGEFERARRDLVPVARAFAVLLRQDEAGFRAGLPPGSTRTLAEARTAEANALARRLDSLGSSLGPGRAVDDVRVLQAELEAGSAALAEELVPRVERLHAELDPARIELRPRRSSPLLAALKPLDAGLAVGWLFVLALAFRPFRRRAGRTLALAGLAGVLAGLAWRSGVGGDGLRFTSAVKDGLTRGDVEARSVVFAPVPYGFAEQHPEESLRPPTWLASAALDERGAYRTGGRAPRPDPVTGFAPVLRPVEVRAGEPALNSPWRHLLGTDLTGRDLLARVLHGGRVSLFVGALATALLAVIGVLVGAVAGTCGGWVDSVLSRTIEVVVSFPLFFLVLVAVAFLGPSLWNVVLGVGCLGWTSVARLARSEFQRQRGLAYVSAARVLGFSWARVVLRHVLPNALAPLLVAATFAAASAILVEAGLSFLGYGVRVPIPSWGAITSESRELANWWLQLFPGLFLFATVLCVQLVGDALRDALDPRHGEPA